ncbi:MAG TPA: TIGR03435 family protein [Bryobacteraceae bacterium]|nr:TIGR03435 family protein [Bryobacteraceae bacterium]
MKIGIPAAFLLCATALVAQTNVVHTDTDPKFDAASVKPVTSGGIDQRLEIDASRFSVRAIPLANLILQAFDINQYQLSGAPAWMNRNLYAINASIAGPADRAQVMEMLRNLLMERFHLKTHFETRQTKVYELVLDKGGLKTAGEGLNWRTIPELVRFLNMGTGPGAVGWPVIDRTGLSGEYDLRLKIEMKADPDGRSGTWSVDYLAELPRQLGLRLQPARDDYRFLVIDHVEEPTAE